MKLIKLFCSFFGHRKIRTEPERGIASGWKCDRCGLNVKGIEWPRFDNKTRYKTKQFDNGFWCVIDTKGIAPQPIAFNLSESQADIQAKHLNLNTNN